MKFEVDIPDEELKEAVMSVIANKLYGDYAQDRSMYRRVVAECVRETIYKEKSDIVDRVVAQASREVRSKAVKKLLTGLGELGDEHEQAH